MNAYHQVSKPLLHRPVESAQYASHDFRSVLGEYGITSSMSRKGNC